MQPTPIEPASLLTASIQTATRLRALRQGRLDDALAPLRARFLHDLARQADEIDALTLATEALVEAPGEAPGDPNPLLRRIQAIAHRLAGVSAVLGFPTMGTLAQRSELALAEVLERQAEAGRVEAGALAQVGALLDDLVVEMESQAAGQAPGQVAAARRA